MTTMTWTQTASDHLEQYLRQTRAALTDTGADPDEVIDDLRRHIEHELLEAGTNVVTLDELVRVLGRIGPAQGAPPAAAPTPVAYAPPVVRTPRPFLLGSAGIAVFGVGLPFLTVAVEWATGTCASIYVNPIPSPLFAGLILLAALANLVVLCAGSTAGRRKMLLLGLLNGMALTISFAYAVLFLPLAPFALVGILAMGLGLLPLSPLLSFISALACRRRLTMLAGEAQRAPGLRLGLALGAVSLALAGLPIAITDLGLHMAGSDSAGTRSTGISLLRSVGDRARMLDACQTPGSAERAQRAYFLVTGNDPAAAVANRPRQASRLGWDFQDDFDPNQGSTTVGTILPDLALTDSRIDGFIDPDAAFGYMEWTLVFSNSGPFTREARAQVALPPGGVVSRLTLWINGEEREAAFGGRAQVQQAYQSVAIQQRRDPVLVTTAGPGRITVQCFPVPPRGQMKTRIGITFPLALPSMESAVARMPRLLERNFQLGPQFAHAVWIESPTPVSETTGLLKSDKPREKAHALRGGIADDRLGGLAISALRSPSAITAWTRDTATSPSQFIVQRIGPSTRPSPRRVVLVVDGSRPMAAALPQIADAIKSIPSGREIAVLVADDAPIELSNSAQIATPETLASLAERLTSIRPTGGCDNIPALCSGWDLAAESPESLLIWVHGPQPLIIDSIEPLRQRWDRHRKEPRLLAVQVIPGRNRILDELDGVPEVSATSVAAADDLKRLVADASASAPRIAITRSIADEQPREGVASSAHLARLWAADEVHRLVGQRSPGVRDKAMALAVKHQLVTPVSGAVVLETAAQYAAHQLKAANPATVPMVPEPGSAAMLITLASLALLRRRRKKTGRVPSGCSMPSRQANAV